MRTSPDTDFSDRAVRVRRGPAAIAGVDLFDGIGFDGIGLWPLWVRLGWNDILQRYRRPLLGPFWLTASMAIIVIASGILYAGLFKTPSIDTCSKLCNQGIWMDQAKIKAAGPINAVLDAYSGQNTAA